MRVQIWCCDRCGLQFVADDPPPKCPHCWRQYSGQTIIRLLGREIVVESVRIYGDAAMRKAMTGSNHLRLGMRCPHGWMAPHICVECCATKAA